MNATNPCDLQDVNAIWRTFTKQALASSAGLASPKAIDCKYIHTQKRLYIDMEYNLGYPNRVYGLAVVFFLKPQKNHPVILDWQVSF